MADLKDPILPGPGGTDYERYLRTDELLSLQKPAGEMAHRDELIFQIIHQTAELWLKLACEEVDEAVRAIDADDLWRAVRLLRRATDALDRVQDGTLMLEHIAPWDYRGVRMALGHGSGFDSPGFIRTAEVSPTLARAFGRLLERRSVSLLDVYRHSERHEDVFQLAERLVDWDQRLVTWRGLHLKLVERIIGGHVTGTQGTPVEVLGKRIDKRFFPELWNIRDAITGTREED